MGERATRLVTLTVYVSADVLELRSKARTVTTFRCDISLSIGGILVSRISEGCRNVQYIVRPVGMTLLGKTPHIWKPCRVRR